MELLAGFALLLVGGVFVLWLSRRGMTGGQERGEEAAEGRRYVGDDIEDWPVPGQPSLGSIEGSGFTSHGSGGGVGGGT